MIYGILFEQIVGEDFPPGYYYAHVPSLGLTTHGRGVEGSRQSALDLLRLWMAKKRANNEPIPSSGELFFSTLDISEDALQMG